MNTPVIDIRGVAKHFGTVRAVEDVTLAIEEGEMFGLIGHNGAGKSTLLRIVLGLVQPDAGSVSVFGERLDGGNLRGLYRRSAYVPENVVFYDNLSGRETLRFYAALKGVPPARCTELLEKVGLDGAGGRAVREYSKGMRQRLGLAQALLGEPRLLLLDEPTIGLDPVGIREFYQLLAELRERGVCILLSSHNLAEIQNRVDRLALMRFGRVEATGTLDSLRAELALPIHFRARLRPGSEAQLEAALVPLQGCTLRFSNGDAHIECAPEHKMALLGTLTSLRSVATDIDIREPSLEDVFHGYRNGRGGANGQQESAS